MRRSNTGGHSKPVLPPLDPNWSGFGSLVPSWCYYYYSPNKNPPLLFAAPACLTLLPPLLPSAVFVVVVVVAILFFFSSRWGEERRGVRECAKESEERCGIMMGCGCVGARIRWGSLDLAALASE